MEFILGQMVDAMKAIGFKGNSMVRVSLQMEKVKTDQASGRMETK